jgi:hypothetical protein
LPLWVANSSNTNNLPVCLNITSKKCRFLWDFLCPLNGTICASATCNNHNNQNEERNIMEHQKEDNSAEVICMVLFAISVLVIAGVAWAVH